MYKEFILPIKTYPALCFEKTILIFEYLKKKTSTWVPHHKMDHVESKLEIIKLKKSDSSKTIRLIASLRKPIHAD